MQKLLIIFLAILMVACQKPSNNTKTKDLEYTNLLSPNNSLSFGRQSAMYRHFSQWWQISEIDDIKEQIKTWQSNSKEPLAPVQINLGHSCIYLFGETLGQEDEAWCQGQVLGKSTTEFLDQSIVLFDVVILREDDDVPFVVRIASLASPSVNDIQVHDYIQANIWLQAAIYGETQRPSDKTA